MRKLVLFGLLAGVFGLALALENLFSRQTPAKPTAANDGRVVLQLGGGPPRSIPVEPPVQPVKQDEPLLARGRGNERPRLEPALRPPESEGVPGATHLVAKGETLSSIARSELGSTTKWKELARWNAIADAGALREGTTLRLSPPSADAGRDSANGGAAATDARTHKIAKGETLSRLAARYLGDATRWREIQRLNGIADPASVAEGSTLRIPER